MQCEQEEKRAKKSKGPRQSEVVRKPSGSRPQPSLAWRTEVEADIEAEYRTGQDAITAIARKYGVHEKEIRRRAKKYGWERDLVGEVRKRVNEQVMRGLVRDADKLTRNDAQIVSAAADRATKRIDGHLIRSERMAKIADKLMDALERYMAGEGEKVKFELVLGKSDGLANLLKSLATILERTHKSDRMALSLDEPGAGQGVIQLTVVSHVPEPDPLPAEFRLGGDGGIKSPGATAEFVGAVVLAGHPGTPERTWD